MDARRKLVSRVLDSGLSVAAAAREAGVSRQTVHLWLGRARAEGVAQMQEYSRRPHQSPSRCSEAVVDAVHEMAQRYPSWGPAKLHALLWPAGTAPVSERTVARILARAGRRILPARAPAPEPMRFERSMPNELWQTDFKRAGHRRGRHDALTVIDDAARFCIALRVVPDQTLNSVWGVLWSAFGEFGMPEAVLSDNGPAFRNNATWRWSSFDLRLMLLGIRPLHGKPYHPQTQGKVERLHGTIERELRFEPESNVQELLEQFRNTYNWTRPHQALDQRTPGSLYQPSNRRRPAHMPEPFFPDGALIRKCQDTGIFSYGGTRYKLGRAFEGLPIGLLSDSDGGLNLAWGEFVLGLAADLKV